MLHEILGEISHKSGVKTDVLRYALELSLEGALCGYFNIQGCDIDLETRTFVPFSEVPLAGKCLKHNPATSGLTFDMLPTEIIGRCRHLFMKIMHAVEADELYKKWRHQVHKAVEGQIGSRVPSRILVNLGDQAHGIMERAEWVPLEMRGYRKGKLLSFYVLRVKRRDSIVDVYLSRGSLNLPAALLRLKMPWANIRGLKRIRGKKCWLKSDRPVEKEILKEVSGKLKGEAIEIKM